MVVYTYDGSTASDQKHGFLKFWTLELESGVKWSSGTTLDDCPKKIPAFFLYFLRYLMHQMLVASKYNWKIGQFLVAFSEYLNFTRK